MFVKILRRAVQRGFVARDKAAFVEHGLRFGFNLGVDTTKICLSDSKFAYEKSAYV